LQASPLGHRDAGDIGPRCRVAVDLAHAGVDVVGVARGHGLDRDRGVATDFDAADAVVAHGDLTGLSAGIHGRRV